MVRIMFKSIVLKLSYYDVEMFLDVLMFWMLREGCVSVFCCLRYDSSCCLQCIKSACSGCWGLVLFFVCVVDDA